MAGYEMPLDSVLPRGTAESVRQANWLAGPSAVNVFYRPGLLCSVRGRDPVPPVTGYLCRYCRQRGPGHIGVAENRAGEVIALPLRRGQPVCVGPGRFLCATGNVRYRWEPSVVCYSTMMAEREYPMGRYLLNLSAAGRQGLVLLHASGDAFIRDLADDQSVLVSPSSLLYWEDTVGLSLHLEFAYVPGQHVRRAIWRSSRIWLRVCGPGRVAVDSAREQPDGARTPDHESFASWQRWDALSTTTTKAE